MTFRLGVFGMSPPVQQRHMLFEEATAYSHGKHGHVETSQRVTDGVLGHSH